ncbi:hypothetical protein QAD02_018868 [Eretmocerus hayati]|uniref:Uncharacterized protein n=1 Tax=Eretmocerus hayati TaxID=131215 RepID=A0ACC2PI03_9HYME|nr:hypothetical protein QAD02_018868 [Eretmocerus hayati]
MRLMDLSPMSDDTNKNEKMLKQDLNTHSEMLTKIGLKYFCGTVYTTDNKSEGYSWGKYPSEGDLESDDGEYYLVDGEPIEKFKLIHTGSIRNECSVEFGDPAVMKRVNLRISQRITVRFFNNLHEISQDYNYEVRVIAKMNKKGSDYYQQVSCGIHNRYGSQLLIEKSTTETIRGKFCEVPIIRSFHFIIRRFNRKINTVSCENVPSIGEMLLNDESYSDASLVVGDRIFSIHKRILALKSDVFKSMFTHRMTENEDGIVNIDDLDAEVMEELIYYIYTGKTKNLSKIPRELFEAAHKYQIHDLEEKCKEHVIFNLNFENAVDVLQMASVYDLPDLREKVSNFIEKYEDEMVYQENYQNFLFCDLSVDNVASTLLLCVKYNLDDLKSKVFDFLKDHKKDALENKDFMDLFNSQASLMQDIFRHLIL